MQQRMVQRGLALGLIGVLGAMFIPGSASGSMMQEEGESNQTDTAYEAISEQGLTAEEQEAMRAWVASMAEASPMGDTIRPNPDCIEKYSCPSHAKCSFPDGKVVCAVTQCGDGKCGFCPEFINKLVFKGWCAYGCLNVDKMVGGAFILKHQFPGNDGNTDPYCIDKNGKIYDKNGKPVW